MTTGARRRDCGSIAPFLATCLLTTSAALAICLAPSSVEVPADVVSGKHEALAFVLAAEGVRVHQCRDRKPAQ